MSGIEETQDQLKLDSREPKILPGDGGSKETSDQGTLSDVTITDRKITSWDYNLTNSEWDFNITYEYTVKNEGIIPVFDLEVENIVLSTKILNHIGPTTSEEVLFIEAAGNTVPVLGPGQSFTDSVDVTVSNDKLMAVGAFLTLRASESEEEAMPVSKIEETIENITSSKTVVQSDETFSIPISELSSHITYEPEIILPDTKVKRDKEYTFEVDDPDSLIPYYVWQQYVNEDGKDARPFSNHKSTTTSETSAELLWESIPAGEYSSYVEVTAIDSAGMMIYSDALTNQQNPYDVKQVTFANPGFDNADDNTEKNKTTDSDSLETSTSKTSKTTALSSRSMSEAADDKMSRKK